MHCAPRHWAPPQALAFATGATVAITYDRTAALAVAAWSHSHTHGGGKDHHALAASLALAVRPSPLFAAAAAHSLGPNGPGGPAAAGSGGHTGPMPGNSANVGLGAAPGVSEPVRRVLLQQLRGLVRRLKLPLPGGVCLHATSLLLRCVCACVCACVRACVRA